MARICIEATPSDNLRRYELRIDDDDRDFIGANNNGCINVRGACGDGSIHNVYYVLVGQVGATLGLKISCDGIPNLEIPLEVFPPGPLQSGDVEFVL